MLLFCGMPSIRAKGGAKPLLVNVWIMKTDFIRIWMLILLVAGSSPGLAAETAAAPSFFISNLNGERFISRNVGDPIVLSFFFVDCMACRKEMPGLYGYLRKAHPRVRLLFIDPLESDTTLRIGRLASRLGIPERYFYFDALGAIAGKFGVNRRFPTIIGIRNGRIVFRLHDLSEKSRAIISSGLK